MTLLDLPPLRDARPVVILRTWDPVPVFHVLRPWNEGGHVVTREPLEDGRTKVGHISRSAG